MCIYKEDICFTDLRAEQEAASVRAFRSLVGRAQSATPVAPAMLAQIASQARILLGNVDLE